MEMVSAGSFMAGFFFGLALSVVVILKLFCIWIMGDPDGPGGWRSRLQQLGAEHSDKTKGENK